MTSFRDELDRIADSAPEVRVEADTWEGGRRAHRRSRLSGMAAVGCLVVFLAVLALPAKDALQVGPTIAQPMVGVPNYVWKVPERLQTSGEPAWNAAVSPALAIGRASVAFTNNYGAPVLIGDDGRYHLLNLPMLTGDGAMRQSVWEAGNWFALAPNGLRLAYALSLGQASDQATSIVILNLEDGSLEQMPIPTDNAIRSLTWSPNSRWLLWQGPEPNRTTGSGWSGAGAGRIDTVRLTADQVPISGGLRSIAIDSSGVVTMVNSKSLVTWDGRVTQERRGAFDFTDGQLLGAVQSPGSARLAASQPFGNTFHTLELSEPMIEERSPAVATSDSVTDARTVPLGWLDDDFALWLVTPYGDSSQQRRAKLVVAPADTLADTAPRVVGRVDYGVTQLSVAVDLVTLDRPTVPAIEPDWPWSSQRKGVVFGIPGVVGLVVLVWWWGEHGRRRRLALIAR